MKGTTIWNPRRQPGVTDAVLLRSLLGLTWLGPYLPPRVAIHGETHRRAVIQTRRSWPTGKQPRGLAAIECRVDVDRLIEKGGAMTSG
jgi:hypothetical protein